MSYEHNIPKVASFLIYEQFCLSVAFCPKTEEATFCCSLFPALFRASEATVGFVSGWIAGTAPAINLVCFFSPISFTNFSCGSGERSDWVTRPPTKSVPWTNLTIVDANWHLLEICASYALFLLEFPEYWMAQRSSNVNKLRQKNTKIQGSNDFRFLLCSIADVTGWDGVFEGMFNFATLIQLFYKKMRSVWNFAYS